MHLTFNICVCERECLLVLIYPFDLGFLEKLDDLVSLLVWFLCLCTLLVSLCVSAGWRVVLVLVDLSFLTSTHFGFDKISPAASQWDCSL